MSSLHTSHPLQRMAERLAHACRMRDVRVLNAWLCGHGLPRLTPEGERPHEVLWQLIYEWWQPDPEALAELQQLVCDALDACAQALGAQGQIAAQGTGTGLSVGACRNEFGVPAQDDGHWPGYCHNLFALCARLPQHAGVFARLAALDDNRALGHRALASLTVGTALQQALVEQQVDDRLLAGRWQADFLLALGQIGANNWREPAAMLLAAWRAMVLAASDGLAAAQCGRPELRRALDQVARLEPAHGLAAEQLLADMLAQWPAAQGGRAQDWRQAVLAAELPPLVHSLARDLWPDANAIDHAILTQADLASGWRRLGRAGREQVRAIVAAGDARQLAAMEFDLLRAGRPRSWVVALAAHLRQSYPPLRAKAPSVSEVKHLRELDIDVPSGDAAPTKPAIGPTRSNFDRFMATTEALSDIGKLLVRRKVEMARKRGQELLNRQASDHTPAELQSKSAAHLATLFAEAGQVADAQRWWQQSIDLNPADPVARCGLADVLKAQGELDGARAQYEATMHAHPQNVVARCGLADVLKAQGDLVGARAQYEATMRAHPQDVFASNGLAEVLKAQGDLDGARAQYEATMRAHPQDVVARCGLADVLKAQGDLVGARAQYEATMRAHPQDVVARCGLADVLKAQGELVGARALYEATMRSHPQNAVARCGLAEVLKAQGDLAGARAEYEATLGAHPQNVVARCGLAEVLKAQGDLAGARAEYEAMLGAHPQDVVARNGLANLYRRMGRPREGRALLQGWAKAWGRQRLLDGVVYALCALPESPDEALGVLDQLLSDVALSAANRTWLMALRTSLCLKIGRATKTLPLADPALPIGLRAWVQVVCSHQQVGQADKGWADGVPGDAASLGPGFDQVKQLLDRLARGDAAANEPLFELEVEGLLAA